MCAYMNRFLFGSWLPRLLVLRSLILAYHGLDVFPSFLSLYFVIIVMWMSRYEGNVGVCLCVWIFLSSWWLLRGEDWKMWPWWRKYVISKEFWTQSASHLRLKCELLAAAPDTGHPPPPHTTIMDSYLHPDYFLLYVHLVLVSSYSNRKVTNPQAMDPAHASLKI